ncbi:MAG: hypothetical protein ABEL04_13200 [Salinibacter sp.]|uniref:hypothetical protein n=1 Tax=Salinibacter sp. TaxID=2065818 RepID=UPI0035D4FF55
MLKRLPEKYLPDPESWLPASGTARKVEGSLLLAAGTVGLSFTAALLSGWYPTAAMASALSGRFPAALTFSTAAWMALWVAYLLWRSKRFGGGWEEEILWLWGWGVAAQLLVGTGFLVMAAYALLDGLFG